MALLLLGTPWPLWADSPALVRVRQFSLAADGHTLQTPPDSASAADRLLVIGPGWVEWLAPVRADEAATAWQASTAVSAQRAGDPSLWRVWLVHPAVVAETARRWPSGASLYARVDEIGPTAEGVWIAAGEQAGIRSGHQWWLRRAGQPVARFEVRLVAADLCYSRCVPLAEGWRPRRDDWVELWPAPAAPPDRLPASAVAFVETAHGDPMAWVAAPLASLPSSELRFDFFRDGRYVGFGVFERGDARFWKIRTWPAAGVEPLRVGDQALARDEDAVGSGRACGRVFSIDGNTALMTAGELDHIHRGAELAVTRAGAPAGTVRVTRVQKTYCEVERVRESDGPLKRLDEVRVRPEPSTERLAVARIETVRDRAWRATPLEPLQRDTDALAGLILQPLAIERDGMTIGVGMTVASESGYPAGFVLPHSSVVAVEPGDVLVLERPARP